MPGGIFDINSKINELSELSIQLQDEKIWSDRDKSLELSKKRSSLEKEVSEFTKINDDLVQIKEFKELYDEDQSDELYDYLSNEIDLGYSNFIVLGDWNDDLKDNPGEHCFDNFLKDGTMFFPTYDITYDLKQASYPKEPYVSFLDHILISNSLVQNKNYYVKTLPFDDYMGSFNVYEQYISDHMPVLLSICLLYTSPSPRDS